MLLLHASKLTKSYGEKLVINLDDLKIYYGEKIGIVGINGAGKTTFLNLLAGRLSPDSGHLKLYTRLSYIEQSRDPELSPDRQLAREFMISGVDGSHASGGEKTRLKIASALDEDAGILFADEPTANLDLDGIKLLENKLMSFHGAMLLVSHDRTLLDRLCHKIIEIQDAKLRFYSGNYSSYLLQREADFERQFSEYRHYSRDKKILKETMAELREKVKKVRKAPKRMGNSEARLHKRSSTQIQKKLSKTVKAIETRLNKMELIEKPKTPPQVRLNINQSPDPIARTVVSGECIDLFFGSRCIFRKVSFEIPKGKKTALVGINGSGKTTLANMIASGGQGVKIAPGTKISYFSQDLSANIDFKATVLENAARNSTLPESVLRTVLARLLFNRSDLFKPASLLSGGERVKLSLAGVLTGGANMIILDEPTNYLDLFSMEALESVLRDHPGTMLIISHDRKFLNNVAHRVLIIEDCTIKTHEGLLTEYYRQSRIDAAEKEKETAAMTLRLKLSELAGKLSNCKNEVERVRLEREYSQMVKIIKTLNSDTAGD